ncbi:MAG TPA: TRAP transporter substrate-binding protein DctP [Burkholderiaceae bacterium]|jgi:TRAP-type C4-dicarboxylate transport system substrate-binding protein|nr:TRAP transporter substrate-binding protein DctP [Burkholderiaceae bacterium]HRA77638.1 TRAP transporter substrate-binding protein DctP [Burkholderiaceae bacterium]
MTVTRRAVLAGAASLPLVAATRRAAAQAEVTLNAVHFTPAQVSYARSFLKYVEKVNGAGKGIVQIRVRGGPEVVPFQQMGEALKNGLVDMVNYPAGPMLNLVPEGEVFSATSKKPWELRANGGFELIDGIFAAKANARVLAHVDGGAGFHIFTVDEPVRTADGGVDFSKLKIRSAALYREFLESLGAGVVVQSPGETYTSLERGLVNANCYTVLGYQNFGWNKFTRFRIDPGFFQTDVLVMVNKASWDKLGAPARKILQDVAIEHERDSYEANLAGTREHGDQMIAAGMKVVALQGAARAAYLDKAARVSWERLAKRDASRLAELRAKFAG